MMQNLISSNIYSKRYLKSLTKITALSAHEKMRKNIDQVFLTHKMDNYAYTDIKSP